MFESLKALFCSRERWLLVTLVQVAQSQDEANVGVRELNQCQRRWWKHVSPQKEISDTNIHRKHSPRYTDVPVFVHRWNEAESEPEDRGWQRERERRTAGKKETEETEECVTRKSFLATVKLLMQLNKMSRENKDS